MARFRWVPSGVLGAGIGALLVMFAIGGTTRMLAWYLALGALPPVGALLAFGCLVRLGFTRHASRAWVAALVLGLLATVPASWALRLWPVAYPSRLEDAGPGLAIRVPTDRPMRVAWGGDSAADNQHAITADQRWAYDLVVAPYFTGGRELADFGCFGVPVVAPIAGEVVAAVGDRPDVTPGEMDPRHPLGNHVVVRPDAGGYLVIAHLQRGSVRVAHGDRVEEGQIIGACGNSGNTSEPHVHVHYQRQHPDERPFNFADGLPLYFRDHGGKAMPSGGLSMRDGRVVATGDEIEHAAGR